MPSIQVTCSIGFDDPKFNETEFAQQVADRYKTNHRIEIVNSDDFGLVDLLAHRIAVRCGARLHLVAPHIPQVEHVMRTVALVNEQRDRLQRAAEWSRLKRLQEQSLSAGIPTSAPVVFQGLLLVFYLASSFFMRFKFRALSRERTATEGV